MILMPRDNFNIFDDVFEDPFFRGPEHGRGHRPPEERLMRTDIKDKGDNYEVQVELPGYNKDNISINIEDGYLNIHAKIEKNEEKKDDEKFVRKERFYGECSRSFYIGEDVLEDSIKAKFTDGILTIDIPKKQIEDKKTSKCIEIE